MIGPFVEENDPFYWFTHAGGAVSETFDAYCQWHKAKIYLSHVSLIRNGDIVTLMVRGRGYEGFNAYTVELGKGANLIGYDAADSDGFENWKYEFVKINGSWVPSGVTLTSVNVGAVQATRTLRWVKNIVNEPVKDEEFSLLKLGLRQGDWVQDNRQDNPTGRPYRVKGAEYPPAPAKPTPSDPRHR
jgi:hypothetical protein